MAAKWRYFRTAASMIEPRGIIARIGGEVGQRYDRRTETWYDDAPVTRSIHARPDYWDGCEVRFDKLPADCRRAARKRSRGA